MTGYWMDVIEYMYVDNKICWVHASIAIIILIIILLIGQIIILIQPLLLLLLLHLITRALTLPAHHPTKPLSPQIIQIVQIAAKPLFLAGADPGLLGGLLVPLLVLDYVLSLVVQGLVLEVQLVRLFGGVVFEGVF